MFNYNPGSYPQPQYPQFSSGFRGPGPNYNQFVPSTNKRFVRSLEEALSLPADLNSQNVYFDINQNVMYDICTNGQGEKSWAIFDYSLKQNSNNNTVKSAALGDATDPFEKRFKRLEDKLEELLNGKHDVKQTDAADAGSV